MSKNLVILIGSVGKDPEIRSINNDTKVAKFSLATNESYKKKNGEKVTNTEWHNIEIWRGLANVVENYVKKGSKLYLEGKIKNESYEKDGHTKYITKIVCNNMIMLDSKGENTPKNNEPANDFDESENMPF